VGYRDGEEVKSSAEEEDSDAVVEEVTETSGIDFEGLDFGVKPLGDSISDWEENEVKQTVEMAFKHTGHLLDFVEPASDRAGVPLFENTLRFFEVFALPEGAEASRSFGRFSGLKRKSWRAPLSRSYFDDYLLPKAEFDRQQTEGRLWHQSRTPHVHISTSA